MPRIDRQTPTAVSTTAGGRSKVSSRVDPGDQDPWSMVDGVHCLVYGESGTGKTRFTSTFPGPILWLICSGGNKPGELRSIDTPANRRKITPRIVRTSHQMAEYLDEAKGYATTVLDHASGFADLVLLEILRGAGKNIDEIPAQKGWGLATMQQYGEMGLQCKQTFRVMLNLPGNVVIVAQQRTFGGKDDGVDPDIIKPTVGAALSPSVTGWLNPACDYVVQTFKRPRTQTRVTKVVGKEVSRTERVAGVDYCLRCEPHDVFMTKFRVAHDRLPDVIVNPTYDKMMAVIRGEEADGAD